MTELDIKEKIYQKRQEINKIKKDKEKILADANKAIRSLDDKEFDTSKSIKNLLKILSLQKGRFKCYVDVMYKGKPAVIFSRNIDDESFEISYSIGFKDGTIVRDIYEDDSDLDDVDLSRTKRQNEITSKLYEFMERFNHSTHKWKTKNDWKNYEKWIKRYDKDILTAVEITDNKRTVAMCFKLSHFFRYVDSNRSISIKDVLLKGANCKCCGAGKSCGYSLEFR